MRTQKRFIVDQRLERYLGTFLSLPWGVGNMDGALVLRALDEPPLVQSKDWDVT